MLTVALQSARQHLCARLTVLLLSAGSALQAEGRHAEARALNARGLAQEPAAEPLRLALRALQPLP